jgi:hypothetical protein
LPPAAGVNVRTEAMGIEKLLKLGDLGCFTPRREATPSPRQTMHGKARGG